MFDAIASPRSSGRSGRSVAVSLAIHGILVGAAVGLAWFHGHDGRPQVVEVKLPPYQPGSPIPAPLGSKRHTPRTERAKPRPAARPMIEPKWIPLPVESPPAEEPMEDVIGSDSGEAGNEGVPWGVPGGQGFGPPGTGPGPIEFNELMTPPRKIGGPDPQYTHEAQEKEIQGTMLVKCVVTTEGIVRDCRVLKSLPYMDRAVIEALESRRYAPALLHGRPIDVDYTFKLVLTLPR